MKKKIIIICLTLLTFTAFSQDYDNAIGIRFGYPTVASVDFKHNFDPHWAIEAALGFGTNYSAIDVLGLYHFPIQTVDGLRFYVGAGLDMGVGYHDHYHNDFILGASLLGGIEYTFSNIPLNLFFDLGPRIPLSNWNHHHYGYWYGRSSIGARFTF